MNRATIKRLLTYINPLRFISRLDRYIIGKFIGTYIYAIILIISISIVFDVNENLAKFTQYHAPLKAIVFDYYMNFVPYFANLFSRCSCSLPSSSLHQNWPATQRLLPCWQLASRLNDSCDPT